MDGDTTNDEAIARALAREDSNRSHQQEPSAPLVVMGRRPDCPSQHGLQPIPIEMNQIVDCSICWSSLSASTDPVYYGCFPCHYRVCQQCSRGLPPRPPAPRPRRPSRPPAPLPATSTHMCYAPCIIGDCDICTELLVDTGASMSVMSMELATQLDLSDKIDRSVQGTASGVGQAKILGKLYNVRVELGQVEFRMDFAILGGTPEKLLLLGLDLMRRYKCIVDLESDVLIFGGKDGVQVPLLPADEQHEQAFRNAVDGCSIM